MNWERVQVIVREDLEATAPSDAEILARFSRRRAERETARAPDFFGPRYAAFGVALCAAAGALLWLSFRRSPMSFENIRVTQEVWSEEAQVDRATEEPQAKPEVSVPSSAAPAPDRSKVKSSKDAEPRASREKITPLARKTLGPSLASAAAVEPRWEEVARAMRDGEEERARELIVQLRGSSDAETRDNARLADVQMSLEMRDGVRTLSPNMLAMLKDLRATGATSSIRASARRLLGQLGVTEATPGGQSGLSGAQPSPALP